MLRDADDRDLMNVLLPASDRGKLERFLNEYFTVRPRALGIPTARSVGMLVPQEDDAVRGRTLATAMVSSKSRATTGGDGVRRGAREAATRGHRRAPRP